MRNIRQEDFIGVNTHEKDLKQVFTEDLSESEIQEDLYGFNDESFTEDITHDDKSMNCEWDGSNGQQHKKPIDLDILDDQESQESGRFFEKFKELNDSIIASVKKYPPTSNPGPKGHPMCDRYFLNFNLARFNDLYLDDGSNNRTDDGQTVVHAIVKILNLVTELDDVIGRSFENNALTLAVGDDPKSILDWNNCPYAKVIEYDLPKKFEQDGFIRSLLIEKFKKHCMILKVSMFGETYVFDGEIFLS